MSLMADMHKVITKSQNTPTRIDIRGPAVNVH
jgi:hypothetical protein